MLMLLSVLLQAMDRERNKHLFKVLVVGEIGTGKTSIIKQYVHTFFSQHYRPTVSEPVKWVILQNYEVSDTWANQQAEKRKCTMAHIWFDFIRPSNRKICNKEDVSKGSLYLFLSLHFPFLFSSHIFLSQINVRLH